MRLPRILFLALPFLTAASLAAADTLKLDCVSKNGDKEPLKIDLGTETVTFGQGWPTPAVVTDDTVSWSSKVHATSVTYTLHRKWGGLTRASESDPGNTDLAGEFTCKRPQQYQ